jgi:hypothetical protein
MSAAKPKSTSWNLWTLLDPERWVQPDLMRRHGLFGIYLIMLMILYIAHIHRCESLVRNMSLLEKSNQELRSQYLFLKTELVSLGQLERVSQRALAMGLFPLRVPPLALNRSVHEFEKRRTPPSSTSSKSRP